MEQVSRWIASRPGDFANGFLECFRLFQHKEAFDAIGVSFIQPRPSMESIGANRPRNVDWKRAAALLYGDWGTSKAYVFGLAFAAAGFGSLPMIIAVCVLTALVGINYAAICRYFPDGGGVYSAARSQGRTLAVIGALLLVADLTVTAALSGWDALEYLGVAKSWIPYGTIFTMFLLGFLNSYGPKHSGTFAMCLALPR